MLQSSIPLGSARALTRADDDGKTMELIPDLFYVQAGVGDDVIPLGSARLHTRADDQGQRSELVPTLKYDQAGDA